MNTFKVSNVSKEKAELNKLASVLQEMGEDSFVEDVIRISSMIEKPEIKKKSSLSKSELDALVSNLQRSFSS